MSAAEEAESEQVVVIQCPNCERITEQIAAQMAAIADQRIELAFDSATDRYKEL